MQTQPLLKLIDLHKSIIKNPTIFMRAAKGVLTIASVSPVGSTLVTKLKEETEIVPISIDATIFSSFLKNTKQIELSLDKQKLSIKGSKLKGEIPFNEVEEFPKILPLEESFSKADADWLSAIIPLTVIKSLDRSGGYFAAQCVKKRWSISCSDKIHGAFAFADGNSNIKFSLTTEDTINLASFLKHTADIKVAVRDNLLIIQQKDNSMSLALNLIEGEIQTKEIVEQGSALAAKISLSDFKDAIRAVGPIAAAKEAPPIEISLKENHCTVKASSSNGALLKQIDAQVKKDVKIKCSFELLNNLLNLLDGKDILLFVVKEENEIVRITLKANNIYYLMLTSS